MKLIELLQIMLMMILYDFSLHTCVHSEQSHRGGGMHLVLPLPQVELIEGGRRRLALVNKRMDWHS